MWQGSKVALHQMDAEEPEVSEHRVLPDTQFLAELPKVCLQVGLPADGSIRLKAVGLTSPIHLRP